MDRLEVRKLVLGLEKKLFKNETERAKYALEPGECWLLCAIHVCVAVCGCARWLVYVSIHACHYASPSIPSIDGPVNTHLRVRASEARVVSVR